jgi:formylglycine-generating enzyme required for sulfatase activity
MLFNGLPDWPEPGTDYGTDLNRPVQEVRWYDAVAYSEAFGLRTGMQGQSRVAV